MKIDLKNIHIGNLICKRVKEMEIQNNRICNFLNCNEKDIEKMYSSEEMETGTLMRWSKLLEYDFFRLFSQHLILYSPPTRENEKKKINKSTLPQFRKNLYTREIINFIVELYITKQKSKAQIMTDYGIPKATLHRWIEKYSRNETTD